MTHPRIKSEVYSLLGGINTKSSPYINEQVEFRDIKNLNFKIPGALTQRPGSTLYTGATVAGRVTGGVEFERLNGASYIVVTLNTNVYDVTNGSFSVLQTGLSNGLLFDFQVFVDRLFYCSGETFKKWEGTNLYPFSLPPGISDAFGVSPVVGGGMSGIYICSYGYLNERGYYGPISNAVTISLNGITFGSLQYSGMTTPSGFGITAITLFRTAPGLLDFAFTTYAPSSATGATDTNFPLTTRLSNDNLYFTLIPKMLEIYNNQMFLAGFSAYPSTVYWSDIGDPESIAPEYVAEFRSNDGDKITGMKAYQGAMLVTKERSCHLVRGDDPTNFIFQEISDQYGCISSRTIIVFENLIWWLDTKGIVQFTGANISVISNPIEPIFDTMNISAARDNACAIHYRDYNELWFSIPTDGATYNNTIVVYDYLCDKWTTYKGIEASHLFLAKGNRSKKTVFVGGYTGNLITIGASLTSDSGVGITTSFKTAFMYPSGQSVENMYRRFFLNIEPIAGATLPITVNFYKNYGTSLAGNYTMYRNAFQNRIDFGISAKSLQTEIIHSSASYPLTLYGFTIEHRYQRSV